jgi:RimJ/RimL family protein N-acetyltransferase
VPGLQRSDMIEVYAESAADNWASRRVLEKAMFQQIGERETNKDGRVDQWIFAK